MFFVWISRGRHRKSGPGCFAILWALILIGAVLQLVVWSFQWWLADWHWTWVTPLAVLALAGIAGALSTSRR